jgi:2-polyprenyl-3-methyl-5-hydroxy-6-metoxy-1,4-benzoquinol methylase
MLTCILCSRDTPDDKLCSLSFGTIVRCRECGLVRVEPARTRTALEALHSSSQYFSNPYFVSRRSAELPRTRAKYRRVLTLLTGGASGPEGRLLDVGCDTGALLVVAREEFGLRPLGIEMSTSAADVARTRNALEVVQGAAEEVALAPAACDYVTMLDVLEHVADPVLLLRRMAATLKPNGRLYLITPDHDALIFAIGRLLSLGAARLARPLLERLYIPQHEFYFTRRTLTRVLALAGLRPDYHARREFPIDEFGHGLALKLGLWPVLALERLLGRPSLQEVVAIKEHAV